MEGAHGEIDVAYAAVEQAQQDIQRSAHTIDRLLQHLDSSLEPLVATWTGTAAEAYRGKHTEWVTAADLNQVLHDISRALGEAHTIYRLGR